MRFASVVFLVSALLVPACGGGGDDPPTLPASFRLGTAIAGFQVDMGCPTLPLAECNDPSSDWYVWVTAPDLVADSSQYISGDPMTKGPGFTELYEADLDRVSQGLRGDSMRLSLEWSRIFPASTVGVTGFANLKAIADPAALAFYHAVFAAMKDRGLTPLVTINHYTLPTWIHDAAGCHSDLATCTEKGWVDPDALVPEIAKYAGFVAGEFAGEVDLWATLNEPFGMLVSAYLFQSAFRSNPPGLYLAVEPFRTAVVGMIEAHARMYDAVKASDGEDADGDGLVAEVGLVYNLTAAAPKDPARPDDVQAAENFDYLMNRVFLNGAIRGDLDPDLDGQDPIHRGDLAGRCDFLGVNYYLRNVVTGISTSYVPSLSPLLTFDATAVELDPDYPQGLGEMLTQASEYGLPLYVTETGTEDPDDDGKSGAWVVQTLQTVESALAQGIDVRGYYYWTLMDLFEWNHGMNVPGGLYQMDGDDPSKTRVARKSVELFRRIAEERRVPDDLKELYPLPAP